MALTEEIKAKLTPEQAIIAEKWEAERSLRQAIFDKLENKEYDFRTALAELDKITPDYCEHDRSIMGTCIGCDEIERIIRPELFEDE